jgi:protocadherin alpha
VLTENSDNIVDLVQEEYNKITSSVEMKDTAQGNVKVTYWSRCLNGKDSPLIQTSKCDKLKVGDVVEFETEIIVTQCPTNEADRTQTFKIYPVGVGEELVIDLEMICSCDCEKSGPTYEPNSGKCNEKGTLACGICECHANFFGRNCECNANDLGSSGLDFNKCRPDNTTDIECSGRGNCLCGQCQCNLRDNPEEVISGQFCECDNFSCDRHNSILCSGPENGICECGTCKCFDGWEGNACDCSTSKENCMAPNGQECSGHGKCVCGRCECEITNDVRYSGKYCEKCPTCPGRCDEFKACVECQMYKKGPLKDEADCSANCTLFTPISVESVEYDEDKDEHLCTFYDEDDCRYRFVYNETVEKDRKVTVHVRAQQTPECPPKVFLLGIVLGVIAAIVLIGLAMLLLWKLLTTIHDRREFARFEKERMMAKWDTGENPIYKQATSTFKNPTYAGK